MDRQEFKFFLSSLIAVMMTAFHAMGAAGGTAVTPPDFAFPDNVITEAEKALDKALGSGDTPGALRAMIDLTLAQNSISSDRMPVMLERIDSMTQTAESPDMQSLLYLLQARIYSDIYNSERYSISARPTPAGERPADYKVWSPKQYEQCIIELCNSAMGDERALLRKPLSDYKKIVTTNTLTLTFYPRLYDFVSSAVISMLDALGTTQSKNLADEFREQRLRYSENGTAPYAIDRVNDILAGSEDANLKFDLLHRLYDTLGTSQYRIEAALAMSSIVYGDEKRSKIVYPILTELVKKYPRYPRFNCLVNEVTRMSQPELNVRVPVTVAPGCKFTINGSASNLNAASVTIYRIPDSKSPSENYYRLTNSSLLTEVAKTTLAFAGTVPFSATATAEVVLDQPGLYIAVPSANGLKAPSRESYRIIHCSKLSTGILTFDKSSALVVDPVSGAPVEDAEIIWTPERKASRLVATTDSTGMAAIDLSVEAQLQALKGADRYSPLIWYYPTGTNHHGNVTGMQVFTALSIYHPGDSVDWAVVAYSADGKRYNPCDGRDVEVMLRNANGETVDTVVVRTDDYGRAEGKFELPQQGLTGYFNIIARIDDQRSYGSFMVSDYKMPTFEVKVTETVTGVPEHGAATLRGTAMTYSGMPLAGADVKVTLTRQQWLWRWGNVQTFDPVSVTATTDSDGRWVAEFSRQQLEKAGANAWFNADVTVTSQSGEMQQTTRTFAMGTPLRIRAQIPASLNVSDSVALDVKVVNTADSVVEHSVSYELLGGKDFSRKVTEGIIQTPDSTMVDWREIAAGTYRLCLSADGDTVVNDICIYRPDDKQSPSTRLLWTPDNQITFTVGTEQEILIGTPAGTTHVLYTLWDNDGMFDQYWMALEGGIHKLRIIYPHGGSDMTATFIAARDMTNQRLDVKLKAAVNPRDLNIAIESMRDNVMPGETERWTLRVTNAQNVPVGAAIMAEMYNKALDALSHPGAWQLNLIQPYSRMLNWNQPNMSQTLTSWLRGNNRSLKCTDITVPSFDLYGMGFGMQTFRRYGSVMYKRAAGVVTADMAVMKSASPAPAENGFIKTEEADDAGEAEAETEYDSDTDGIDYRDANVTLAFFRPMMRTDRDGTATLEFTVPQANATWALNVLAYTADMRTTSSHATILSQKPVMVKPNPPRFLRQGDKAVILTAVMNATDQSRTVNVTVEAATASGDQIAGNTAVLTLEPKATVYVPLSVEVTGCEAIILTARAESENYTDAERDIIPVLEATTPVIGSIPFYMAPDSAHAEISLPAASGATTTLEFCSNPAWYVVTALPGLRQGDILSAPAAADAIFSCAVAQGILRSYPSIAQALKEWTSSDRSEDTLTSLLARNEDMKTILLNSTPWMMDARSQTERMERLALLFDNKAIDKTYSQAIAMLSQLMRTDGGWSWVKQNNESSVWVTDRVLSTFGRLKTLGYFPDNRELQSMVNRAISYIDARAVEQVANRPQADMTDFAILRTMYPDVKQSTAVSSIVAGAVQHCVADWRQWPLSAKPQVALLLYRNGYATVASEVLESMSQFMEQSPEKGSWFPSIESTAYGYLTYTASALEAYATIAPQSPQVDGLMHWLIRQKQATEWGSSAPASQLIATILKAYPDMPDKAPSFVITLNGRTLETTDTDRLLGYMRTSIDTGTLPSVIAIDKTGRTQAWGSVMRRSTELITEVAPASIEDLSIEKRILTPENKSSIELGDRLTVELTIRVGRNMNYVTITDGRAACLEPVDQTPFTRMSEGIMFYMEPRTSATNIFVTTMPKGTYVLTYEVTASSAGSFASGIVTVQSQQAPELTARSGGTTITINSNK